MSRYSFKSIITCAALLLAASNAGAVVNTLAYYRLGEADPGAGNGVTANTTVDSSAFGFNGMTRLNTATPTYTNATAPGSSLGVSFDGDAPDSNDALGRALPVTTTQNNFGIEARVFVRDNTNGLIAYNGRGGGPAGGWGLYVAGGNYSGLFANINFNDTGIAPTLNTWQDIALVRNNGVNQFYINGVLVATNLGGNAGPQKPTSDAPGVTFGGFKIGGDYNAVHNAAGTTTDEFNGIVDEVRVFTFAPGSFAATDLLANGAKIQPQTLMFKNSFEAADAGKFTAAGNGGVTSGAGYGIGSGTNGANLFAFNGGGQTPNAVVESTFFTIAGAEGALAFDYGNFGANQPQQMRVEMFDVATNTVLLSQIINDGGGTNTLGLFEPYMFNFTALGSSTRLRFTDVNAGDVGSSDGMLDNIRVVQFAIIPEPATAMLGLLSVAGLMIRRRRNA